MKWKWNEMKRNETQWPNEWIKWMDGMNGWNEWMNEWINEWMNEWNEWMKWMKWHVWSEMNEMNEMNEMKWMKWMTWMKWMNWNEMNEMNEMKMKIKILKNRNEMKMKMKVKWNEMEWNGMDEWMNECAAPQVFTCFLRDRSIAAVSRTFPDLIFQKCSQHPNFLRFWNGNRALATVSCTFFLSHLPKVLRTP